MKSFSENLKNKAYPFMFLMVSSVFIVFAGCAGVTYNEVTESIELDPFNQKEKSVKVLAKAENWSNSGVVVKEGSEYEIIAKGRWIVGGLCGWTGAEGVGVYGPLCWDNNWKIVQGWSHGVLIGKIGSNGKAFVIGDEYKLKANSEGVLYYRINDGEGVCGDNDGFVNVTTTIVGTTITTVNTPLSSDSINTTAGNKIPAQLSSGVIGEKWAVVIGISKYQDTRIPMLRYASADAKDFHQWLISPNGGKYAPSRVKLLIDHEATYENMKESLFNWLRGALEEDVVTIFFAGHGSPETLDDSENLFLLPFDTQYDRINTSSFPMWDIETALKRFIKAKKVVVIADACHSGGIGKAFDVATRDNRGVQVNPISSGIQNLSQVGDGVCVITASSDKQLSQESKRWGGGHGVFTYFLLKGLNGDADYNMDEKVTIGELTSYLSEHVRRETKNTQSPTVAGRYDPALTIGK